MLRRSALRLVMLFAALNILFAALGQLMPPAGAAAGFIEGCADRGGPCWFGVMPGVTTTQQAQTRLTAAAYRRHGNTYLNPGTPLPCSAYHDAAPADAVIGSVVLFQCEDLDLGQVMATIGYPTLVIPDCYGRVILAYGERLLVVAKPLDKTRAWLSPFNAVTDVFMSAAPLINPADSYIVWVSYQWQGFGSAMRYRRLQTRPKGCWYAQGPNT